MSYCTRGEVVKTTVCVYLLTGIVMFMSGFPLLVALGAAAAVAFAWAMCWAPFITDDETIAEIDQKWESNE